MEIKFNDQILHISIQDDTITLSTDAEYSTLLNTHFTYASVLHIFEHTKSLNYARILTGNPASELEKSLVRTLSHKVMKQYGFQLRAVDNGFEIGKQL